MEAAPLILMAGSTVASTIGSIRQGQATKAQDDYVAQQERVQGGQDIAAAQRAMLTQNQQTARVESNLQASAAASGGGATDVSVVKDSQEIAQEGSYRALTAMYDGQAKAQGLNTQATDTQWQGGQAATAGYIKGFSTLLQGGSSLYNRFNPGAGSDSGGTTSDGLTAGKTYGVNSNINYDSSMEPPAGPIVYG